MVMLVLLAIWVPGLLLGLTLRLRGWTLAAAAPVLTFGAVATGTAVLGRLGFSWSWWSFGGWVLGVAVVLGLTSWLMARRAGTAAARKSTDGGPAETTAGVEPGRTDSRSPRDHVVVAVGVLAGLVVGAVTFLRGIGGLGTINQDWDAPFHANAIRWIAEHGDPLPSALAPIANEASNGSYFYPNTYHALLALVFDPNGGSMPEVLNLGALAMVLAWPLGVAAVGMAWRMPALGVAAAAAVSTWFSTFPYDQLWRGPLWPYVAGVALIPATLALARHVIVPRGLAGPVGLGLAGAGLVGLHPSVAFVLAAYAVMLLLALLLRFEPVRWRVARLPLAATVVVTGLLAVLVMIPALSAKAGVTAARWPLIATPVEGFGQAILFSPNAPNPQWWLGIPALVGIGLLIAHRRLLWVVGAYLIFAIAYAGCASLESQWVFTITGPFYNDAWRFGALLPLAGALAIGELVNTLSGAVRDKLTARFRQPWLPVTATLTAGAVMIAMLGVLGHGAYLHRNTERLAWKNNDASGPDGDNSGATVTKGEREAFQWLKEHAGDSPVMNDHSDGSVWMYALAGVKPVDWSFYGSPADSDSGMLNQHFNELDTNPDIRRKVDELGVRYVMVGRGFVRGNQSVRAPGMVALDSVPGLREVYTNPDATIYQVTDAPEPVSTPQLSNSRR
ncbi:hypothetical protein GCM10012275_14190 [Longimycelium tulufanense]|uniref:Uncharacterized protein n=1 Tax=Longimycelium tulufanense TaxID=907463 RepID=A0A8J3CDJ6_9PSEU|nr:DUF6541 family protein [Longimycelium tulufanense]GGM44337.1 hypothetical protein GCM10012275_14190 [Longimycelium tulufanense]